MPVRRSMTLTRLAFIGLAAAATFSSPISTHAAERTAATRSFAGLVRKPSAYGFDETVARLKADIEAKGIMFFMAVEQSKLGETAGVALQPSTLLVFGNPALGLQFLTSNPNAGLDWPVRLLVTQDADGRVWTVYTDFAWIMRRHGIRDRDGQFKMASDVISSITSSVRQ